MESAIVIPGYQIKHELGRGGMATVYQAVQESLNRDIALKVMNASLVSDEDFKKRFDNEGKIIAKLEHPNIVTVYDRSSHEHHYYIAMELLNGGMLKDKIKSGLSNHDINTIASALASALGFAHRNGFVHRDIKPNNVLFRHNGSPVLTDFGIAKALGSATQMTAAGYTLGSAGYMSPEQSLGKPIDHRSDLYSFGVLMWEMLTGETPYEAEDAFALALKHATEPVPSLPLHLAPYQPILNKLLAKNPGERYNDAEEFISDISALSSGNTQSHPTQVASDSEATVVSPFQTGPIPTPNDTGGHNLQPQPQPQPQSQPQPHIPPPSPESDKKGSNVGGLIAAVIAVVALAIGGVVIAPKIFTVGNNTEEQPPTTTPPQNNTQQQQAELARQQAAEEAKQQALLQEQRRAEEERKAQQQRLAEEERKAQQQRLAEEERKAQEQRLAEEQRKAEEQRRAEEQRKVAEERRLAEQQRKLTELARRIELDYFDRAEQVFNQGDWEQALRVVERGLNEVPTSTKLQQFQTELKIKLTTETPAALTERKITLLLSRAEAQWEARKFTAPPGDNAFETYNAIRELDPDNSRAMEGLLQIGSLRLGTRYENLARELRQSGDLKASLEKITEGLKVSPDHPGLLELQAIVQTELTNQ